MCDFLKNYISLLFYSMIDWFIIQNCRKAKELFFFTILKSKVAIIAKSREVHQRHVKKYNQHCKMLMISGCIKY